MDVPTIANARDMTIGGVMLYVASQLWSYFRRKNDAGDASDAARIAALEATVREKDAAIAKLHVDHAAVVAKLHADHAAALADAHAATARGLEARLRDHKAITQAAVALADVTEIARDAIATIDERDARTTERLVLMAAALHQAGVRVPAAAGDPPAEPPPSGVHALPGPIPRSETR